MVAACRRPLQPHAATAAALTASSAISSMPAALSAADQLHQRIDIAADHAVARFHALDRRDRQAREFRELALVDPERARAARSWDAVIMSGT